MKLKFEQFGKALGTRHHGRLVKEKLVNLMNDNELIVLDFENIKLVFNSFADELFGKLVVEIRIDELKRKTTFINVDPFVEMCILKTINDRLQKDL